MKKISLAWLVSLLSLSGMVFAATPSPTSEIRESTDPDKAAAVERRAEELRAQQQQQQSGASGESASGTGAAGKPMHERKRMHKSKRMHSKKPSSGDTSGTSSDTSSPAK